MPGLFTHVIESGYVLTGTTEPGCIIPGANLPASRLTFESCASCEEQSYPAGRSLGALVFQREPCAQASCKQQNNSSVESSLVFIELAMKN